MGKLVRCCHYCSVTFTGPCCFCGTRCKLPSPVGMRRSSKCHRPLTGSRMLKIVKYSCPVLIHCLLSCLYSIQSSVRSSELTSFDTLLKVLLLEMGFGIQDWISKNGDTEISHRNSKFRGFPHGSQYRARSQSQRPDARCANLINWHHRINLLVIVSRFQGLSQD